MSMNIILHMKIIIYKYRVLSDNWINKPKLYINEGGDIISKNLLYHYWLLYVCLYRLDVVIQKV